LRQLARRGGPSDIKRYREATTQRGGVVGQAQAKNPMVDFKSPMPSYRDKLSSQELADLLSYLVTLKGQTN